ncbi:MAG: RIP metalloprotease RseP [Candidatus Competibacterales bacterium]
MSLGLINLIALLITLGVLITVHELGHFWVARLVGVKVLRFSIGFGPPLLLRRDKSGTEYALAAIPLGGYVRMLDEREGDVAPAERDRAFNRQSVGKRIAIVAAGPLFNLVFAVLVYAVMYSLGVQATRPLLGDPVPDTPAAVAGFAKGDQIKAIDDDPTPTLDVVTLTLVERSLAEDTVVVTVEDTTGAEVRRTLDLQGSREHAEGGQLLEHLGFRLWPLPAQIGAVLPDSPAANAGLAPGDRIVAIDGQAVDNWSDIVNAVRPRPEESLAVMVERDGTPQTFQVQAAATTVDGETIGRLGIGPAPSDALAVTVRLEPLAALAKGVTRTWEMSLFTLRMLGRMVVGQASLENLSGPLTIAHFAGQAASIGIMPFLSLLALVRISLAVLNLLPIPILDGGHLLYYAIELVKGSPVSEAVQSMGQRIGLAVLLLLMSLALFNDFARLLG